MYFIYTLTAPQNPQNIRYIGVTNNPHTRLLHHIRNARAKTENSKKAQWIREVLAQGYQPLLTVIYQDDHHDSNSVEAWDCEVYYINLYRSQGHKLLNTDIHWTLKQRNEFEARLKQSAQEETKLAIRRQKIEQITESYLKGEIKVEDYFQAIETLSLT